MSAITPTTSEWVVTGLNHRSRTVYLTIQQTGECGGGVREVQIPWRSTNASAGVGVGSVGASGPTVDRDPVIGERIWLTLSGTRSDVARGDVEAAVDSVLNAPNGRSRESQ